MTKISSQMPKSNGNEPPATPPTVKEGYATLSGVQGPKWPSAYTINPCSGLSTPNGVNQIEHK